MTSIVFDFDESQSSDPFADYETNISVDATVDSTILDTLIESTRTTDEDARDETSQVVQELSEEYGGQEKARDYGAKKKRAATNKLKKDAKPVHKSNQETMRKATEILGTAKVMYDNKDTTPAKSSYAFDTLVPDVSASEPLKTYRVQTDYGRKERMSRGFYSFYMPLLPHTDVKATDRPAIYAMLPMLTQGKTAPYMPPPKINDPNLQFNWAHLVDEWPMKSNRPCSNCMHKFDSIPWFIPVYRIDGYYKMDDSDHVFCSYPCERRFLLSSGYPDRFLYLVYLNDIARNYFMWKGDLLAAPLRMWLETLSIEEYRSYLVPPPMYSFPERGYAETRMVNAAREAKWMSDMKLLRPPFLSGTAIMEWVANVVPRAQYATKVVYDKSRPAYEIVSAALMMGPILKDESERGLTLDALTRYAERPPSFKPWRVEGLRVPQPYEIEEHEAHRIVLPPVDPGAPSLIDEVKRMREMVAKGEKASFSSYVRGSSYAAYIEGLMRSKKKAVDESTFLTQMIEYTVSTSGKGKKSRKRTRHDEGQGNA